MRKRIVAVVDTLLLAPIALTVASSTPASADDCKDLAYGMAYNMKEGNEPLSVRASSSP